MTFLFLSLVLLSSFVFCLFVAVRYRWLMMPMMVGFFFRIVLIVLDYNEIFSPPGGNADALVFTRRAFEWSQLDWPNLFATFNYSASYVYSTIGAIFFKTFGAHNLVLPSLNFLAGMIVIFLAASMTYDLWGRKPAIISAYIMALFPFAAFNSVIALREEFSILVFLMGLFFFLKWVSGKGFAWICIAFLFFPMAVMIHPGWIGAVVGVALYLAYFSARLVLSSFKGAVTNRRNISKLISSVAVLFISLAFIAGSGGITLAKGITIGGESEEEGVADLIESRFEKDPLGGSAYPGFVATGNPYTQPWLIPVRVFYFMFSPFPWDIRSPRHALGMVAMLMYSFLAWRLYKGWPVVKKKDECIALLLIFGALVFIFSIGVTNIGTAIRHRTKFLGLFVILAASSFNSLKIRFRKS
ncbi:hypothetical protein [Litchfieldella rifensis]|uniref:Glycosyltransferase RgtA/B/C/D-like domain-containing protein n=1 Tax=Litchfieldella rifensis TaxID=762643 RepID=A0ABV7LSS7_9GAMM